MMEQHPSRGGRKFTDQEFEAAFQDRLARMRGTVEARGAVQTPVDETFRLDEVPVYEEAVSGFQEDLLPQDRWRTIPWEQRREV